MKKEIDSLTMSIQTLKSELSQRSIVSNCDSLEEKLVELAKKPTFLYYYKNSVYGLDLSLYSITLFDSGRVKMRKLSDRKIGYFYQLLEENKNGIEWNSKFRTYDLPTTEENILVKP